ncbi:MAG: GNAT family N-acetyltransferase, partial [Tepidisphaeraceae bacterium]
MSVTVREITPTDAPECGRIVYAAFASIADKHSFPRDIPNVEMASGFVAAMSANPSYYGVVAESDGRIVGSNFLDQRDAIAGVGPITVDPAFQGQGAGRKLMEAVIERGRGARGVRLVQDAFNTVSMSLYTSLAFEVKEPLALMTGRPFSKPAPSALVREMRESDIAECAGLCRRVHGFDRANELRHAVEHLQPRVVVRAERVVGYCTSPTFWIVNHGVAETEIDMQCLLSSAVQDEPLSLLVPTRQSWLFRWALQQGLRVVKPLTLMAMGEYHEPRGPFFPS